MTKKCKLILLIDDDIDDNFFHKRIIEKAGITEEVAICLDGKDALQYLTATGKYTNENESYPRPEIIFLDINMPRMNGWDFLEEYRKLPETVRSSHVIVMVTTSLDIEDRQKADTYEEVKYYQNKPMTKAILNEIMDHYFT
ncbi:response regulator [Chondrinema litorale]|uniref:response regulator n=1 Tax=Chondrinema litorale TaxID=2994555 RepID=UPI002543384A|nr:response regulator [Chondrinema litorale]UZR97599.1 response regulator [Chondrinema litorale]